MSTKQPSNPRPWYCIGRLVEDYKTVGRSGGDLRMLKTLKVLQSIIVNGGVIAITLYSLAHGGEPTIVGSLGVGTLGLFNGIMGADYKALAQAVVELSEETTDDENSTDGK